MEISLSGQVGGNFAKHGAALKLAANARSFPHKNNAASPARRASGLVLSHKGLARANLTSTVGVYREMRQTFPQNERVEQHPS